jgi:hypothetical protein
MRFLLVAVAIAVIGAPAFADTGCSLKNAIYSEPENGYEVRFRPGKSWEMRGMTESIFDLVTPGGVKLWGEIASNMGTSRDVGRVFYGCPAPTRDADNLADEEYEACLQWEGVVYSLENGEPGFMPYQDGPAPARILMTDIGRQIRYSEVVSSPGEEPWDVFDFKRCVK